MASDEDEAPLVGRAGTLETVRATLLDPARGATAAVFVTGESGVGKSRLLREAAGAARADGAAVLVGSCLDIGDASPLHPVLSALRRFDADTSGGVASARELVEAVHRDGAADNAGALLDRVSRGLHELAGARPLMLILDDLQWVDRSTRQLLLYLLAGLGDVRLSVLAAIRAESLQGAHPLRRVLAELRRLRSVRVLDLAPLDRAETLELTAAIVGQQVEAEDAERVFKRSGGNPFVVEELARDLREGRAGLSDTLREIFLARIAELPPNAHAVLHAVVAGVEPVEHHVLAGVLPLAEEDLIEAVRVCIGHRFVHSGADGYRLQHRLVAEVLKAEVLPAAHAALHRRYAETLAAAPQADPARLAYHWQQAGVPDRALPAVLDAAREAERLHAFAEAHRHLTTALDLSTAAADRQELLGRAAEAAHLCGEHARALARLEELAAGATDLQTCGIHIRRARYLAAAGRTTIAETEYERALAVADCTPALKATAAAHLAELLLHLGRYADAGARAREALELATQVEGSTTDLVRASAALGFSDAFQADPDAGLAVVRQAVEIAERAGHPDDIGCAYLHLSELLTGPLNSLEEGVLVARRGAERMAALGAGGTYQTRLLAIAANGLFRTGQWAEAQRVVQTALQHRPSGADAVELLLARCRLSVGVGDMAAAEKDLDAVATVLAGGGARHVLPMLTLRAGLAMWQGRHAEARQAVQRGLTETRSDDLVLLGVLAWHGLRAEAEAHTGREVPVDPAVVRRLRTVVDRITRGAGDAARPVREFINGYLQLCAAELSRIEDRNDPEPWARAGATWDRCHHPYPAAYARLRQAEASFARRTRRSSATAALRQAYATAQSMGARPLAAEIAAVAARARVSLDAAVAPAAPSGADSGELSGLTGREHEVLGALAEGLTNREIGHRLFISERTVGVHVSHIFDKLQVRTRVQASRVFLRSSST